MLHHLVLPSLIELVGEKSVATDESTRDRLSRDEYRQSPVLSRNLPLRQADVVVFASSIAEVQGIARIASATGTSITPRGKGTGNYGQGSVLSGGILLDLSRLVGIESIDEGGVTALAGTRILTLEQTLRQSGRELTIYPSTVQSTVGGFLAGGSGGTGSIQNGFIEDGFVSALDVVLADGSLVTVSGPDVLPLLHAYGTTGIIVRVTVAHEAARDWVAVFASFPEFADAQRALIRTGVLTPAPRVVSADMAEVARTFKRRAPSSPASASFRAVVDRTLVDVVTGLVTDHGGTVASVEEGIQQELAVSMLSYNHPSWMFIQAQDKEYFHVEAGGIALVEQLEGALQVWPGALMHLDAGPDGEPLGMLTAPFTTEADIHAGVERLQALGVHARAPHHWTLDRRVDLVKKIAATVDPHGLLNPGRF
ncbi:FAD-binding oxidoreductase [soil metagenome]